MSVLCPSRPQWMVHIVRPHYVGADCHCVLTDSGESQTYFLPITVSWQGRVTVFTRGPIIQKTEPWKKIIYSVIGRTEVLTLTGPSGRAV